MNEMQKQFSSERPKNEDSYEEIKNREADNTLEALSDDELENKARHFLSEEITNLTQEEIEIKITPLLTELAKRGISGFGLFSFALPDNVTAEEIQSGNSSWAKVYKSLFSLSKTEEYKQNPELQMMVRELENIIDQNPQMMGPVAMWETAKDIMWRRDIPSHAKGSLMGSMTYALAFFDTDRYEAELLKNLDFENTDNYAEVAHMLEALKQFWSSGHESYAEDRVPTFYLNALRKIKETPNANYLLSVRAREILSVLEQSEDFPAEARDLKPFELSKGMYASTQVGEGITVVPEAANADVEKAIEEFDANEEQITPPQWMVDEAIANGESWVSWQPPQDLMRNREHLFNEMHQYAIDPIEDRLGELGNVSDEKKQELLFDYEYLVSRPVREMIQREFDFELKDLSIREQFYFLNYLKRVDVANADTMKRFTSLYGVDGMRTFLSLERGDETLGDHIVAFGQHDEVAGTVFKYYGELLNNSEQAEALVEKAGCEGDHCVQLAEQVRENIINRAQKDLETAVRAHDPSEVVAKIETYVADAKVYVALLQEAVQKPLESIPASEINDGDKEQIRALSARNYINEPEGFQGVIQSGLESALSSSNTRFYMERDSEGRVIFCDRFDDKVDVYNGRTVKYFGSVNAEPAFNGIGRVRITETLEQELANGETMFAHCDPENAVSSLYIEHGFVATGTISTAGKFSFEIWRSNNSSEQLQTKNLPTAELIEQLEKQDESVEYEIRKVESADRFPELSEGKYLTRYFRYNGEYYAVFESAPATLKVEFVPPQEQQEAA